MKLPSESEKSARILVVDDERSSAELLTRMLQKAGYSICITVTDPLVAVERFEQMNPDLMLLDLHMTPITGIEVLHRLNRLIPARMRAPILVITGDTSPAAKYQALEAGATDFLSKPLDFLEVQLRIRQLLQTRNLFQQCQSYSQQLEALVEERTARLQEQTQNLETALKELKETQQKIIQQERLRALGAMAKGITHDLNNGLSLILGYGDLLLENRGKFPPRSEESRFLHHIVRAGQENAELVERLRGFCRPCAGSEEREPLELNDLIKQAISLNALRWETQTKNPGTAIQVEMVLGTIPRITGSPVELRDVLNSLISNAIDAMPHGGALGFRTYTEGQSLVLEVSDTGTGMSPQTRQQCLEPFFTTKGEAASGLGLATSYGIVRRHGGSIAIKSELDHGTTVTISLPYPAEAELPNAVLLDEPIQPLRVLIVDDHPEICEVVGAYLSVDQHTVTAAYNGREALDKYCNGEFDLVITDRAMPEVNGNELAAAIKRIHPHRPVIMLTGLANVIDADGDTARNVDLILSKPAGIKELRGAIHKAMQKVRKPAVAGTRVTMPVEHA